MLTETYRNREVQLRSRSRGMPQPENFIVAEQPLPRRAAHQLLVRNRWQRVSISTRLMMSEEAEGVKGIPFPPLQIGDTLADAAIGEVIAAPAGSALRPGDVVLHGLGWREYALLTPEQCTPLGNTLRDPAAYLGHGWTAYAALTRGTQIRPGDRVLVTSGAGAIGSMAGQIARLLGAATVAGSCGSQSKAAWMRQALGYDAVAVRGEGPFAELLARCLPDGIDVLVDIVGGEQLEAAVSQAREGARYVLMGALSAELAKNQSTKFAPVEVDAFALIVKGVTMRGYSADDHPEVFDEWIARLADPAWAGLTFPSTRYYGLEAAPQALADACSGKARGVVIVEL